jgi:hypothetical protein
MSYFGAEYKTPFADVFYYKYLKFYEDGSLVTIYTSMVPSKFVPKFINHQANIFAMVEENMKPEKAKFVKGKKNKDKSQANMLSS